MNPVADLGFTQYLDGVLVLERVIPDFGGATRERDLVVAKTVLP
jgi:hypothetical protein